MVQHVQLTIEPQNRHCVTSKTSIITSRIVLNPNFHAIVSSPSTASLPLTIELSPISCTFLPRQGIKVTTHSKDVVMMTKQASKS
jgi:hypothetical protein